MKSFVFKSSLFDIEPDEDRETNPMRYGKQLASWIASGVRSLGYSDAEMLPEDWGWCIECSRSPFRLWIGCGNQEDTGALEGRYELNRDNVVWECFVAADVPILKRIFGAPDTRPALAKLHSQLGDMLAEEPRIQLVTQP